MPVHPGYQGLHAAISRHNNNSSTTNTCSGGKTRTASHRAVPYARPEPARRKAALTSRGAVGTPCPPLLQSHLGPAQICRREGFPSAEAGGVGRGADRSSRSLPALINQTEEERSRGGGFCPPSCVCSCDAATAGEQGSPPCRRPECPPGPAVPCRAPQRRAVPPGAAGRPLGCSGRSESFCVRVPARRGLFALQQLSHYLHWL